METKGAYGETVNPSIQSHDYALRGDANREFKQGM